MPREIGLGGLSLEVPVLGLKRSEKDRALGATRTRPAVTAPPAKSPLPLGDFTVGKSLPQTDSTGGNPELGLPCTRCSRDSPGLGSL